MMIRRLVLMFAVMGAIVAPVAYAHQQKAAITTVSVNSQTGALEIAHRFVLHDAEHALQEHGTPAADMVLDPDIQQQFADYVAGLFSLRLVSGAELDLDLLGYEIERGAVWVYQEGPSIPDGATALIVESGGLRDVWTSQINTVNFDLGGEVRSLVFSGPDRAKVFQLIN